MISRKAELIIYGVLHMWRNMIKLTIPLLIVVFVATACKDRVEDDSPGADGFSENQPADKPSGNEDPFRAGSSEPIPPSPPKRTTPADFVRDFSRETTLSKLNQITFASFETGDDLPLSLVLAIIQAKTIESDFYETEPFEKGIHFEVWDWRRVKGTADYNRELSPYRPLSMAHDDPRWEMTGIKIRETTINLGDLIAKVAAMAKLDVYLSSGGIILVPEGQEPNPAKRKDVTVWQRFP
ncbi:MAG: hypothetical protein P1V20_29565 [Verrucomicrobiales bacterium]|nr:hypothetical protein [Verrucomicrobiales bacterium]